MNLYVYDHCPYCVRVRMILGLKKIPFHLKTLLYDDESTPIGLVGQKMLPILEGLGDQPMPESMDIVQALDQRSNFGKPMVEKSKGLLNSWLEETRVYFYLLTMPRWVEMNLEEFSTDSARQYFRVKKEKSIGPFSRHLAKTKDYLQKAQEHLQVLEKLIQGEKFFWEKCTEDDFYLFEKLRSLTVVKDLIFPVKVSSYLENLATESRVPLYWDQAL